MKPPLRRLLGCLALGTAPLLLLGAPLAPLYTAWVESRARRGRLGRWRTFQAMPPTEWSFYWAARDEDDARTALAAAIDLLVRHLPAVVDVGTVERLEIENPGTGFSITPEKLQPITRDFGPALALLLEGEHAEFATLVVTGSGGVQRLSLSLDARTFVSGDLWIEVDGPAPTEVVEEIARSFTLSDERNRS